MRRQLDDREVIHLQESREKLSQVVEVTSSQRHGRPNDNIYDGVRCVTRQWAMGGGGGGGGRLFLLPSVDGAFHSCSLRPRDVDCLGTVVGGSDVEFDELAIAKGRHSVLGVAVPDIPSVGEDLVAPVGQLDETVPLLHIKPLDMAYCWGGGSSRHAGGLWRVEKGQEGADCHGARRGGESGRTVCCELN